MSLFEQFLPPPPTGQQQTLSGSLDGSNITQLLQQAQGRMVMLPSGQLSLPYPGLPAGSVFQGMTPQQSAQILNYWNNPQLWGTPQQNQQLAYPMGGDHLSGR